MDNTIIRVDEIPRVEWRNERVVTTAQLAEFYETSEGNLRVNFFYAQKEGRFVEGKHFFRLEDDALRAFKHSIENFEVVPPQLNLLYLWTKRGAVNKKARHMSELFFIAKQKALC